MYETQDGFRAMTDNQSLILQTHPSAIDYRYAGVISAPVEFSPSGKIHVDVMGKRGFYGALLVVSPVSESGSVQRPAIKETVGGRCNANGDITDCWIEAVNELKFLVKLETPVTLVA